MKFKYKIQNKSGEIVEGVKESPDKFTLSRDLRLEGGTPISIEEYKERKFSFKMDLFGRVSLSDKIMFTNNLSGMLSAGLPISRALIILEKQSTNQTFKKVLNELIDNISKGNTLSDGMRKFPKVFSGVFIPMVHSGEESGGLPKVLSEIGQNLKKSYDLNKKIKGALTYPTVILSAMILIGIFMMAYVVPTLTKTFKDMGTDLPASTKFIIWLSDFISNNVILFLVAVVFVFVSVYFLSKLKITKKYFDFIILRIPVLGKIVIEVNTARTARTLSSLLLSGLNISKALSITEEVLQNVYYKKIVADSIISIEKGFPISNSFKSNTFLYPIMMSEMIEVGEETGNLSKMLTDVASFYENEVDNKTKNLSTIVEPVLMLIIGGAVGFFAVSMITPMYSVMSKIK
ncbi:TPA: type II secretion system F family protein [Candidatus Nomurabacteria bacterium]|nr:MAG: hypothetical protein O210_OD1C00001G0680 [Parcubacteria bacterium RAAC4_OD1_1]HCY26104.1 type II secretion system F family protein [Candidatus Nomurabacteria bacterium]